MTASSDEVQLDELDAGAPVDAEAVERLYAPPARPWVRANLVVSLDGVIELDGRSGGLGGPADKVVFLSLRALADVVLVGAGTVRAEGYGPAALGDGRRRRRVERGQSPTPPVAVLTNRADLDPDSRLFRGDGDRARPIILTCEAAPRSARDALAGHADVVVCGGEAVDVDLALGELAGRGLGAVLCEGGPVAVASLLAADALDELCITHAPVVAGPGHAGLSAGRPLVRAVTTRPAGYLQGGGMLFGRYRIHDRGDSA